jgi:hypothetical protein
MLAVPALLPVLFLRAQPAGDPHGPGLLLECSECHTPERWAPVSRVPRFRHESTGFRLEDAHAGAGCRDCHRSLVFNRIGTACADCHRDVHRGELGARCEQCHSARSWSNQREMFAVHNRTRFPLFSVHANVDCEACHARQQPSQYKTTPVECGACHARTYEATRSPDHAAAGFPRQCEGCHGVTAASWQGATFRHDTFVLRGAHVGARCESCHPGGRYAGTPRECQGCHERHFAQTRNPDHRAAGFPSTCGSCHRETAWRPASAIDHGATGFPLRGAHATVECLRCHAGNRYAGTPTTCFACHEARYRAVTSPNHVAAGFPTECQRCHSEVAWRPASNIDHDQTRFPLRGAHRGADCNQCHRNGQFQGTPRDCVSCHRSAYDGARSPSHAGFPTSCDSCHSTSAWRPASFDHDRSRFPLTGAHRGVDCGRCHRNGQYTGTSRECVSCHRSSYDSARNPSHAGFPTSCDSCHSTNAWRPASFNHDQSRFPLTGAHRGVDCARCHRNGQYAGTPRDCYSCHRADYDGTNNPNHRSAGFPTDCTGCHTTNGWRPASFDHDARSFPIYSGAHRGRWSSCSTCHTSAGNYRVFTCLSCHPHSDRQRTDDKHRNRSGYRYDSAACYQCHPRGR